MDIEKYFYTDKFDGIKLARELFEDPLGVVLIPDIVRPEVYGDLLSEIHARREIFDRAKDVYGNAEQRFFMHYFGGVESGSNENPNFPLVTQFSNAYNDLSKSLVYSARLSQRRISSIGMHIYWESDCDGLSSHRDESPAQLTSVFCLGGYAPFHVADNYELKDCQTFEGTPGSLLLMRGPRNSIERKLTKKGSGYDPCLDPRPIHCLGPVESERTALLIRHIDETIVGGSNYGNT